MVTAGAYRRYEERKKRSISEEDDDKREKDIHSILDEIAKMRGYKEKLIGKRKVRPIIQYADFLLEKKYGFKVIKRGETYYDRIQEEYKTADKNISLIEQYINLLKYQRHEGYISAREYDEWLAKQEGFKSLRDKEESKANELGLSVEEYHTFLARERGFENYDEYQKYVDSIYAIKGTYTKLIPKEDFDAVFKLTKDKWTREHEKFISFCEEILKDSIEPYFEKSKKNEAAVFIDDITAELEKFHRSRPGSLNIYNIDDILIGLSRCLDEKNIDTILSKHKKSIIFRKREI
jgi:hypothetical protein